MAKLVTAVKTALGVRTQGIRSIWRWVHYHQI